jgi:hypothetical protein
VVVAVHNADADSHEELSQSSSRSFAAHRKGRSGGTTWAWVLYRLGYRNGPRRRIDVASSVDLGTTSRFAFPDSNVGIGRERGQYQVTQSVAIGAGIGYANTHLLAEIVRDQMAESQ